MSQSPPSPEPPPVPLNHQLGVPKLLAKQDQLAQATAMLTARLFDHKTTEEIAAQFGVERTTVQRRLRLARKEGVPEEARTIFIRQALPAAIAVILDTLRSSDEKLRLSAAKMVIEGLEAMKLPEDERDARKAGAKDDDTYEIWRERIKVTRGAIDRAAATIEATVSEVDEAADPTRPPALHLREGPIDGPIPESAEDSPGLGESGDGAGV